MKKRERRQEESGEQWVNSMCELLKGGVLAGFSAVLALLLCALLISTGVLREQWAQGAVLAVCVLGGAVGGIYHRHPEPEAGPCGDGGGTAGGRVWGGRAGYGVPPEHGRHRGAAGGALSRLCRATPGSNGAGAGAVG